MSNTVFTAKPENGQTRMCLDPWAKVFVRANNKVCLCCNAPPVGSLDEEELDDILNNQNTMQYRFGLLNGTPEQACQLCPDREITTTEELKIKVREYLKNGVMEVY